MIASRRVRLSALLYGSPEITMKLSSGGRVSYEPKNRYMPPPAAAVPGSAS